ncbi:MAG: glucosamine-fructose-6-phosphate aminotransferase, partial [Fusobacterium sp.]
YLEANKNHIIFYLENDGKLKNRMKNLREYMDSYIKKSILIGLNNGDINISLEEKIDEHLVLLLLVVPIQLMSYKIATFKGINLGIRIFDDFDKVLKSKI